MRSFHGKPVGIEEPILVRVSANGDEIGSEDRGLWKVKWIQREGGLSSGLLQESGSDSTAHLNLRGSNALFRHGDVLLLEPSGRCTVLYESSTEDNVLLITERCNNRCLMCSQPPKLSDNGHMVMSRRILELIENPPTALCLTGGEPTLVWDELIGLLRTCRERFPSTSIQILTNGRRLRDFDFAAELVEAGGDALYLSIPLYADVAEIHDEIVGMPGAFWETLEGIYNLARLKVFVELRIVVIRQNHERLQQWAEFVYRSLPFVKHVAIMGLEPIGLAAGNIDRVWVDPLEYREQLSRTMRSFQRCGMEASIFNHQLCVLPRNLWPYCSRSISTWKRIYLPDCADCAQQESCGGLFHSARKYHSRGILPISTEPICLTGGTNHG